MGYFKGKKVLVYGFGRSGQAAAKLLHSFDANVSIYDDNDKYSDLFCFEKDPKQDYDLVVVSPGIMVRGNELIEYFKSKKITVISELDLGFSFTDGKVIAVTGTNGKTTVTSLLGHIFSFSNRKTFVCGNIGTPISEVAIKTDKKSYVICEVSNFQLELSCVFKPKVAVILNLQEDHIDRHGSFEEYARVKNKITDHFSKNNLLIYNLDDPNLKFVDIKKNSTSFSLCERKSGAYIKDEHIFFNKTKIMPISDVPLLGKKNLENVLAAVAVSMKENLKAEEIREAIKSFKAPPHRVEFVGEFRGVKYYDDSKATNFDSLKNALDCFAEKDIIILVGGQDHGEDFYGLSLKGKNIKLVVSFGESAKKIRESLKSEGVEVMAFSSMKEAVKFAKKSATAGDIVLLSPGLKSFDEFSSYAERGDVFKEIVCEEG